MIQLILAAIIILPAIANAAILDVHSGESIQAAVTAASASDTVLIHEGEYVETVVPYGKSLTIGSEFLMDGDTAHIASTILQPDLARPDTGSCIVYAYGESLTSRLVGLRLRNGIGTRLEPLDWPSGSYGGAVLISGPSAASIEWCIIENSTSTNGGGIAVFGTSDSDSARARIEDSVIRDCFAEYGGGGGFVRTSSITLINCELRGNGCQNWAAGMHVTSSAACFERIRFVENYGALGGMFLGWSNGLIDSCVFDGNGNDQSFANHPAHLELVYDDVRVSNNVFRANTGNHKAIFVSDMELQFFGNTIEENVSTIWSGPLYLERVTGQIAYNSFLNNTCLGGAILVNMSNDVMIHHNIFSGNQSIDPAYGSVLCVNYSPMYIADNLIAGNFGIAVTTATPNWSVPLADNWWGDASGPYDPVRNPSGQGDTLVQSAIQFEPWLTTPPDTTQAARERTRGLASTWELLDSYPNPFNSTLQIRIAGLTDSDFMVTLCDLLGREVDTVYRGVLTSPTVTYKPPQGVASGVYFVRATDGKSLRTRKVVLLK